jgi:UDPglucose 6-dehydrogenase
MLPIGVYGSGFFATVISACLSDFGLPVFCCDKDSNRLLELARATIPYYEKDLEEVIRRNVRVGRLVYSTELERLAARSDVMFLALDSPEGIDNLALEVARSLRNDSILVIATPVPVGTASRIAALLKKNKLQIEVVSQPAFLTDGCAVEDFNWPERIILGTSSQSAVKVLKQLYRPLVMRGVPVVVTNFETAELVRQASTTFLAIKISFINELAGLCERAQADAVDLAIGLGLDKKKIGPRCLQPGAVFAGPFIEADMESLTQLARQHGTSLKLLDAAREVNRTVADRLVEKICHALDPIVGKELGMLGLAFKPNTNSIVGSSSIRLARSLISKGANVRAYDPVANSQAEAELRDRVQYCDSAYAAAEGVDALVVGTAWPEFRNLDFSRIKRLLKKPIIVDTKNLLDGPELQQMGFHYVGVGRS